MTSPDGEDGFAGFDVVLKRRGRSRWKWAVCTAAGEVVMSGSESSRAGARYKAERALFLLLCASRVRQRREEGLKKQAESPDINRVGYRTMRLPAVAAATSGIISSTLRS